MTGYGRSAERRRGFSPQDDSLYNACYNYMLILDEDTPEKYNIAKAINSLWLIRFQKGEKEIPNIRKYVSKKDWEKGVFLEFNYISFVGDLMSYLEKKGFNQSAWRNE